MFESVNAQMDGRTQARVPSYKLMQYQARECGQGKVNGATGKASA